MKIMIRISEEEIKDIKELFKLVDEKKTGFIDFEEL